MGVIATVTVSSLTNNFRKLQIQTQFKKAYAILENVLSVAAVENGGYDKIIKDAETSNTYFAENYVRPYINYSLYCSDNNSTECKQIFKPTKQGASWIVGMNDVSQGNVNGTYYNWPRFLLKNGMFLAVFNYATGFDNATHIRFVVDLNGKKGPNKIGSDIFYFSIFRSMTGNHCQIEPVGQNMWCNKGKILYGGVANYENGLSGGEETCSGSGTGCANVIIRNGFKIPDDYPIKNF